MKDVDKDNWKKVKESMKENTVNLGNYYSDEIQKDIKHLVFTLSRYKFASKLLMYKKNIKMLELGCQEGLGALMFKQNVDLKQYIGIDLDSEAIKWNKENLPEEMIFIEDNFFECKEIENKKFDVVVSLDVIEHIQQIREDEYGRVISKHLEEEGIAIIGTPSIRMSDYACEASKIGHINLYDQDRLYTLMNKYFHNVFIFNMNDEVVNTSFAPMACYIFAVCCNKK